ncbi:2OG-Fe(II) oxygenase [Candidatus Woesearchaeota archaeon]|nr:2OG-Fe(II) oxygenase [Candidatus Woesearchaeota archaeon]
METTNIISLRKTFSNNKPFPYLIIPNSLEKQQAQKIKEALIQETFYEKQSDLFKFKQTNDLASTKNKYLIECRNFLKSKDFIKYLESITQVKLKENSIDLAGTLYEDTDFLLCHDDKLEGRKIAFIYYLSTLKKSEGGTLNFFKHNNYHQPTTIAIKIKPLFNTFVFFKVCPESFHEVEEVIGKTKRYALSGWFHGNN